MIDFTLNIKSVSLIITSYLIGNISPSIIQSRMRGIDIRNEGSGNAGTTNTLRVMGIKAALITLVVDIGKGVLAVWFGVYFDSRYTAMMCGFFAFIGHCWPATLGFKGGKGVATAFGVLLAIKPAFGLLMLAIVVASVLISRKVSVGSIMGALSFPFVCYFMERDFIYIGIAMAAIVLLRHRSNIKRLINGEEHDISFRRSNKED